VWDRLTDERSRDVVEVLERFVDGCAKSDELEVSATAAYRACAAAHEHYLSNGGTDNLVRHSAAWAAYQLCKDGPYGPLDRILEDAARDSNDVYFAVPSVQSSQCDVLRDIFGNPFRPVAVEPAWLAWNHGTVPAIARRVYDERRFEDLPILADALEDAGCTNADLLAHCRGGGPHVRGCWAVDLLLGKP
jgi:hypothetical protein